MSELVDAMAEVRRTRSFTRFVAMIPYAEFLGLSVDVGDDGLVGRLRYDDTLVGNSALPALHGGTIGALLESTAMFELLWREELTALPKTINLTIDYLRSAGPTDTFARGVITRRGRRVANVRVEAWQEDPARPVSLGYCHFLVM
jgi:uncharacterized protein (TIGR00369 family)